MQTRINVPFPPSTNSLFANRKGGRRKTDTYLLWLANAEEMLLRQHRNYHTGKVAVNIFVKKPDNRRRDLDNLAKSVLDFLVKQSIIVDDSKIMILHMAWSENMGNDAYVIIDDIR